MKQKFRLLLPFAIRIMPGVPLDHSHEVEASKQSKWRKIQTRVKMRASKTSSPQTATIYTATQSAEI